MCFVAVLATTTFAQTTLETLQKQMDEQKAALIRLEKENAELRATQQPAAMENEINRLSERLAAGTTLKSDATQIKAGGEFRFRNVWTTGDNNFGGGDNEHDGSYTDARVRINFMYDFTRDVTAYADLQSHWAFGENSTTNADSDGTSVELYQGWLEVRNLFCRPELSSRTGRQEIVLGNQFQFGNSDWFNGQTFDGTRWDWNSESFCLTAIMAKLTSIDGDVNQYYSFQTPHDDDELYSLYFTLKTIKNHKLDIYWVYVNGHDTNGGSINSGTVGGPGFLYPTAHAYFHTIGARIGGWFDVACGLDWNLEAAYQFGDTNGPDADVDAWTAEGELGITFSKSSRFRVFARALYAEGPDADNVGYLTLWPNRHSNTANFRARYGIADLLPMSNVFSAQLGLHFDPAQNWTLGLTALWATTDEDIVAGGADDDYGWEIDVWGEYRYSDNLTFGGGVAFVFADDQGEALWGTDDDTQVIGYLQARLWF
jgi:hypothetical protein